MHEVTLQTVLQDFSAGEEGARRVVRLVREDAYRPALALLAMSREPGPAAFQVGFEARSLVGTLRESGIPPLAALGAPPKPDDVGHYIYGLSLDEEAIWITLAARLDRVLRDSRPVPQHTPAMRVCDHAYLALLRTSFTRLARTDAPGFQAMTPGERDAEIRHLQQHTQWRDATRDAPEIPTAPLREPVVVGSAHKGATSYRAALANTEDSALEKRLAADTLEVPRALVALTRGGARTSVAQANTAWSLLERLGGLSFRPLVETDPPPRDCPRYLDLLVGAALALHADASGVFVKLLDDRREIPLVLPMGGPEPEEIPPKRRVCDQAYVARSKLALYPDLVEHNALEEQFLHRPDAEKDAIIARGKKIGVWDGLTEQEARAAPASTSPDRAGE